MNCSNPKIDIHADLPLSIQGEHLNIQLCPYSGRAWVCVDGHSMLRIRGLKNVTLDGTIDLYPIVQGIQEEQGNGDS